MKTALPGNVQITKGAKELMNECVFEFISFVTSEGISDTCVASFESC
jgi:nuclear transcription Y subunit beta